MKTIALKKDTQEIFTTLQTKCFPSVKRYVQYHSGTHEDAQETLIVVLQKLRTQDFNLHASLHTYAIAVSKNIWRKKLRERTTTTTFQDGKYEYVIDEESTSKDYWKKLQHYLQRISTHCKGLIHNFFLSGKDTNEIQKDYGYTSRHNAQNQKHKCLEQLRKVHKNETQKDMAH